MNESGMAERSARDVLSELNKLLLVDRKEALQPAFKQFTRVLFAFVRQCEGQKSQLDDDVGTQSLTASLRSLKELLPVLESVTQNKVKYPNNAHAKASCELVESHISSVVEGIIRTAGIEGGVPPRERPEGHHSDAGSHFAADVSKLVHLLSPKHRRSLLPDLTLVVSRVVNHSMMVAVTSREGQKAEITKATQEVLSLQDEVCDQYKALQNPLDFVQLSCDFDGSCENLARRALHLESAIQGTVIQQAVDVLVQTTEPMTRIVRAATVHVKGHRILREDDCLSVLQPLEDRLHDHMDQLCQVSSFVASSCSDYEKVDNVTKAIRAIESLDPEVLPACLAARRDSHDKAALAHLRLVHRDWCHQVRALVDAVLGILDLERFLEISENSLESDLEDCRHAVLMPDPDFLGESVNRMLGRAKQVLRVGADIQNSSEDPLYRNGIQVYLDQIKNAVPLVKNGGSCAVRNINDPLVQGQLKERCHHLIEAVHLLREGVNPEKQPELMNPLREHVRTGVAKREEPTGNGADNFARESPTGTTSPGLAASPLPCGLSPLQRLSKLDSSSSYVEATTRLMSTDSIADNFTRDFHGGATSPRLAASPPLHGVSRVRQLPRPRSSSDRVKAITRPRSTNATGSTPRLAGPVFKLDLVFPAGDIVRGVFENDQQGVVSLLNQLKSKSSSLCQVAESVTNVDMLESINPTLATSLVKTVESLHSNTLAALSGDDTFQAECLLSADKWSSEYTVLEESVSKSLQPLTGLFGDTEDLVGAEISKDAREAFTRMTSTLLKTMRADVYCTATPKVTQQVSEWNSLCVDLRRELEQYKDNPEDQSLKDQIAHKRMTCVIKLSSLLVAAEGYLKKRQERWLEVIGCGNSIAGLGNWSERVSEMQRETEDYLKLGDLVSSWSTCNTEDAEKMMIIREDMEDVCEIITDPRSYERAPVLCSLNLLEWGCLMHQFTNILDRLSVEGALRIDRLLSSAHAASSSSGPSKQHFLVEFQGQSEALSSAVIQVRQAAVSVLVGVPSHAHKTMVLTSLEELCRVTPKLISLSRDLADDALPTLSELNHIKRLWVCHAASVIKSLQGLPDVDEKVLAGIERNLRGAASHGSIIQDQSLLRGTSTLHNSHRSPNGFSPVDDITGLHNSDSTSRSVGGALGQAAAGLYADNSHVWQGEEPRLVTSLTTDSKPKQRSQGYRSQPLGLHDASINQVRTTSIPAAPSKPSLRRTNSSNCYSSIEATALMLQQEADKWESSDNPYVQSIKSLSTDMNVLTRYAEKPDSSIPKSELVQAARAIATEASNIHRFAQIFAKYSKDAQFAEELEIHSKQIPALATQLNIIATVKSATPADYSSDVVIVTNAERLMGAVVKTINVAETLCIKGLRTIEGANPSEAAAASLAAQLRRKLQRHRQIEASSHDIDALGLRRVGKHSSVPSLMEVFQKIS